jgi:hypothetical protein
MNDLWSAAKEKNLTILKDICFYSGCAFLLALVASAIMTRWELMLYMVGACIFTFGIGTLAVAQIDSMKANRPVGGPAAKLTDWRFWPFYQSAFDCKCGRRLTCAGVPITPNTVDGGRHCVLCPDCGQGHYKTAEVGTIVTGRKLE